MQYSRSRVQSLSAQARRMEVWQQHLKAFARIIENHNARLLNALASHPMTALSAVVAASAIMLGGFEP